MKRIQRHLSYANVVATFALLFAMTGGVYAATGGFISGGKLRACVHRNGSLTLLKAGQKCKKGLKLVGWSQTGPAGAKGATGSAGATGAQGLTGPSDGYIARVPSAVTLPGETDTTVAQLSLPAGGNYIVTAGTEVGNTSNTEGLVQCTLLEGATPIAAGSAQFSSQNVFGRTIAATASTSGGLVRLSCNPDHAATARNIAITAVKVGALHS